MNEYDDSIMALCGFVHELFEREEIDDRLIDRWNGLREQGEKEGFFPLLIHPDDNLIEALAFESEAEIDEITPESIAALREEILEEAKEIDPKAFLEERLAADEFEGRYEGIDIIGDFSDGDHSEDFPDYTDIIESASGLLIARIPADHPWELAAWIPMGGFNECPMPAEQVAVFKYWHEKYGATPIVVSCDNWVFMVSDPPLTDEDAEALAEEQFAFCKDIVFQSDCDTIRGLASKLIGAASWFFWWD